MNLFDFYRAPKFTWDDGDDDHDGPASSLKEQEYFRTLAYQKKNDL